MTSRKWSIPTAAAILALACGGLMHYAQAQNDTAPPPPGGGQGGGQRGGGRGGFGGGFGGGAVAASGDNVFVLRGATVYRLDAATLTVKAHGDLPAMAMPAGGFGGGGGFRPSAPPPPADTTPPANP